MKKMNKKRGFTITELVIVISVIAILSAVLIPTFSGMVKKANKSAAMQEANHALQTVIIEAENGQLDAENIYYFKSGSYWFKYDGGKLVESEAYSKEEGDTNDKEYKKDDGVWKDLGNVTVYVKVPGTGSSN